MNRKRLTLGVLAGLVAVIVGPRCAVSAGARTTRSSDTDVVGAVSSFAAPLFTAWYQYYNAHSGVNVSYNSVGSGAGIASITARTVDFGASDAPLTPDQFRTGRTACRFRFCSERRRCSTTSPTSRSRSS